MQTFTDTVLAGNSIILFMLINAKYYPDVAFPTRYLGSDVCEILFAELRGFCKGKNNFSFLEMLYIAARVQKLQEIRSKFESQRKRMGQDTLEHKQWLCDLESELIIGMKNAEKEILKTIQLLGMSNELIRSDVLFHNDHTGELTIVNLDSEAYIAEDCFPDELDVLPAEYLADLDNGALLDALDNDQISAAHNLAEIVAESVQPRNSENDHSALEEGDPRLCQYWNADRRCCYMDEDFTEPVCNKWVVCEFPDCGKWWHEICLKLTFTSNKERGKYTFVCTFFGDKVTTFSDDKLILNPVDDIPEKKRRRLLPSGKLLQRYSNKESYVEFNGQVYHIAEFLSLQQGKVYSPSVGRISRWISSGRSTFYDLVDKTVQSLTDNTSKEIALRNCFPLKRWNKTF